MTDRWTRHWRKRNRIVGEQLEPRCLLAAGAIITEFMAINDGSLVDGDGRSPDWIEIHNPTSMPVDMTGYHLTDSRQRPTRWSFPAVEIPPSGYLVVFASSRGEPDSAGHLHTNFSLSGDGEFIALTDANGNILSAYSADGSDYPRQSSNVSYGIAQSPSELVSARTGYMAMPTPGAPNVDNSGIADGLVADTRFSIKRGFHQEPITVAMTTETTGATIHYTIDGSAPTISHGLTYTEPLRIDRTTTLRAIAFRDQWIPTNVDTQSYIFVDDVVEQMGTGLPTTWGTFPFGSTEAAQGSPVPANYAMDPEVVQDPRYQATIRDDLQSLPVISIVMDPDDLWSEERGIYSNTLREGAEWERAASIEMFDSAEGTRFQVDAGVRIHGGFGRRPSATAKHSFRLFFKAQYGASKLEYPIFGSQGPDEFDTIVLRANYNYSWARGNRTGTQTGKDYTLVTDRWAAEAQHAMGGLPPSGNFVHLYVNGLYWGVYNPVERPDASFLAAHQGASKEDYDVMNHEGVVDGTSAAWNEMLSVIRQRPLDMQAVESILDIDNYIDYLILNQFGGNGDWPQNNWYASRRQESGERWQFHTWDAEFFFIGLQDNRVSSLPSEGPGVIFARLRSNEEFRIRFADRIYQHFFHDGALTPAANIERLDQLAAIVDRAMVGESARWGDAWMDQVSPPRTRDDDWLPRLQYLRHEYFPKRHDIVMNQYRSARLYPAVEPPVLSQNGGAIHGALPLQISSTSDSSVVYVTFDGSDPRLPGGEVNLVAARDASLQPTWTVTPGTTLKARAWLDGQWSALVDVTFSHLGDLNRDQQLGIDDIDLLCAAVLESFKDERFDVNRDGELSGADFDWLVRDLIGTTPGDVNLDRIFDSADLVAVFQAGQYEDQIPRNSTWRTGDWNCDGEFTSADLVAAFQAGVYAIAALAKT
jgi:hypothetical protein